MYHSQTPHLNLYRRAAIKLSHALHLAEGNIATVLQAVPGLVRTRHYAVSILSDAGHHHASRRLPISVNHLQVRLG